MTPEDVLHLIRHSKHREDFFYRYHNSRDREATPKTEDSLMIKILSFYTYGDTQLALDVLQDSPRFRDDHTITQYLTKKIVSAETKRSSHYNIPKLLEIQDMEEKELYIAPHFEYMLEQADKEQLVDGYEDQEVLPGPLFYENYVRWVRPQVKHVSQIMTRQSFGKLLTSMFGAATSQHRIKVHGVKSRSRLYLIGNRHEFRHTVMNHIKLSQLTNPTSPKPPVIHTNQASNTPHTHLEEE